MYIIQTENLSKYYGKARGIIDVNLKVESGDFFGFIGPNGAGKSTTIRTLLGLISPTSGKASVFGMDIVKNKTEILSKIGYLPSEGNFYSGMKVADILALSANLRKKNCEKEAAILCKRLELDVSRKIGELSLGNRKKVGIVCALQHKPDLYILDEPTSGLDPLMQRELYAILCERNEEGATVFLSSHILSEVARYCKHAAIIREGKIMIQDSISKLGHTGVKRVTLRGIHELPAIENIRDIKIENNTACFLYSGRGDLLTQILSTLSFEDINISDPNLDEIFMHYYAKEETP
ncbi:MAG: ABC transporter ATP-binding protein [Ruminococcaceae bacterium]|nr:ABC transporter ATP-binding protein [Oscillospiraceae bacterium]